MAATTNVPAPSYGVSGFLAPPETVILPAVQADINAALGGGVNPALETPQGQLASSETAIIGAVNDAFLFLTSQFDPKYAVGRYQDALARIYFIERNPSQPTVTQGLCVGLPGVVIPVGAITQATDGNLYICTAAGTIGNDGTVTLPFACTVPGPIPCPAGTLTTIYQAILGWDTITNATDGVIGNNVESQAAFETRRAASVALNSNGSLPSIRGAVLSSDATIIDCFVTENAANVQNTIGGVVLAPNSLYVVVAGGSAASIAQAIWTKKAPGCAYNGSTTVAVQDTRSGYSPPYPTYNVSFDYAINLTIWFNVVIRNTVLVPSNAATLIQNAIVGAFAGSDGGPRAGIGDEVLASRYYAPIASLGSWAQIVSIEIGASSTTATGFEVPVNINQIPVTAPPNISVSLGS